MGPCSYRRISLKAALESIDDPSVLDRFFDKYSTIDTMTFE